METPTRPVSSLARSIDWLREKLAPSEAHIDRKVEERLSRLERSLLLSDELKGPLLAALPSHLRLLVRTTPAKALLAPVVAVPAYIFLAEVYPSYFALFLAIAYAAMLAYGSRAMAWRTLPLETIIVGKVSELLFRLEERKDDWGTIDLKQDLIRRLEVIARLVERRFFQYLGSLDRETKERLSAQAANIARSLRAKKVWVAMPKGDTPAHMANALGEQLLFAATNDWDRLAERASEHLRRDGYLDTPRRKGRRWGPVVIQVLVIILLLGAALISIWLLVFGKGKFEDTGKLLTPVIVPLALFQVLRLAFGENAPPLKDIGSLVPEQKKGS